MLATTCRLMENHAYLTIAIRIMAVVSISVDLVTERAPADLTGS